MYDRMKELFENHMDIPNEELRQKLEQWDSDRGRAMMSAEKALQLVSDKGYTWWSPKLRNSAITRQYWRLRLREMERTGDTPLIDGPVKQEQKTQLLNSHIVILFFHGRK